MRRRFLSAFGLWQAAATRNRPAADTEYHGNGIIQAMQNEKLQRRPSSAGPTEAAAVSVFSVWPRKRPSVSGVRVRPEGPEKPGDALRARSKMRGGRLFRIGASRLTRTPASVVRAEGANHPNGLSSTAPKLQTPKPPHPSCFSCPLWLFVFFVAKKPKPLNS